MKTRRLQAKLKPSSTGEFALIPLKDLKPNNFNPNTMPREIYQTMLEDMRSGGLQAINPIEVRSVDGDSLYEIVDGESRWRAACELKWEAIRTEIKSLSLEDAKAECYRKNKERGAINPFKEAELFKSEIDGGLTQQEIASKYAVSRSYVAESLRLLTNLDSEIIKEARTFVTRVTTSSSAPLISRSHLEQLASVEDKVQQRHLFETMVGTVRAGRPPPTIRQLGVERAKLKHKPEPPILPVEDLYWDNVWPPEPERDGFYGNSSFPGNCSGAVCKQCLWRYTQPGDLVLDPMSGSGTMVDVCKELKRKCRAFDINPVLYRADIEFGDARKLPLDNESVDFVFIHFPYWRMHYYTDPPHPADLSRMDHENFLKASEEVLFEGKRVLKPGKFLVVLIGDMRKDLVFYDLPAAFSFMGREVGMKLHDKVIKPTLHERSDTPEARLLAMQHNFHNLKFETLLIFKKP